MVLLLGVNPPAIHLGWDIQFSRIAQFIGPRVLQLLQNLAQPCLERGFHVHIRHHLNDDSVASTMHLLRADGDVVAALQYTLHDGWAEGRNPGALLTLEMHRADERRQTALSLRRCSTKFSLDPGEVYYNAGDAVDVACLQGPLLACL